MTYNLPVLYSKLHAKEKRLVREQYIQEQGGLCYWCKNRIDVNPPKEITDHWIKWDLFPPFFLKHPIHLQHNHSNDETEGAVHAYCNAVMWQYHQR